MARRRIPIGSHGQIAYRRRGGKVLAFCRFRDDDGVLREVSASGDTKDAALQALIADLEYRKSQGSGETIRADMPMVALIDQWLAQCECRGLSDSTMRIYHASARLYLKPYMQGWQVKDATPMRVNALLNRHLRRGLDTAALRKHLHQVFALAVLGGALMMNPVAAQPRVHREKQPTMRIGSPKQVAEIAAIV